ncbi:hypothetical protein P280DRAFT_153332 [Massarina eburnea CBS 473.64]|uniref:Fibroin-3 related protein n=1 Tax=Massarina eburnea CBS 473.64 TaxID=1395130 RepID=A0A6A6RMZ2_9PLEO|nr:hypothetical protein P280DRAFT_153332 [Massarina eburnea CBS 473.64]
MPSLLVGRNPFEDAKETLSSWDKCMEKTYCKWPVIVAIIIGGLIVLSLVLCIARCLCCGAELACCCFKCCTCCCPSGGRNKKHKRMKSPEPAPTPYHQSSYTAAPPIAPPPIAPPPIDNRSLNQQYRSHDAPAFKPSPFFNPAPTPTAAVKKEEPQTARFDAHAKVENEDALPPMPSWNDAKDVHIEEEVMPEKPTDVEMDRLDHNGSVTGNSMTAGAVPGAMRPSPGPGRSPMRSNTQDSYGFPQGYQNDAFANGPPRRTPNNTPPLQSRPYGQNDGYGQQQDVYGDVSPVQQNLSPVYGAGAGYAQNGYGNQQPQPRRSPGPGYGQQPGPGYGQQPVYRGPTPRPTPPPANPYGYAPQQPENYRGPTPRQSPPPADAYGYAQPQDIYRGPTPRQSPPPANPYGYAPQQQQADAYSVSNYSSPTPPPQSRTPGYDPSGYAPSGSTKYEAYPGQQTYGAPEPAYPGQKTYQAFNPGQAQGQQAAGVPRRPVDGTWKEL